MSDAGRSPRTLGGIALACVAASALAVLGVYDRVPPALARVGAAPVVLGAFALPLLLWRAPRESSAAKLAVLAVLLSPPLGALVFSIARLGLPADRALALTLGAPALGLLALAVPASGRRAVVGEPLGRAAVVALLLGLALAFVVARSLGDGLGAVSFERVALVQAAERSVPPTNPFLAGAPWSRAFGLELLLAWVGLALDVAPPVAASVLVATAAGVLPLALVWTLAPWVADGGGELGGALLALGGIGLVAGRGHSIDGLAGTLVGDPATALATAWLVGGGFAAAHALRHARAPWVELVGAFALFAFAVAPRTALPAIAALALVAAAFPPSAVVRPRVLLALVLATVPALIGARALGLSEPLAWAGAARPSWPASIVVALATSVVALGPRSLGTGLGPSSDAERRALRRHLAAAAALGLVAPLVVDGVSPGPGAVAAGLVLGAALLARGPRPVRRRAGGLVLVLLAAPGLGRLVGSAPGPGGDDVRVVGRALVLPPNDASSDTERDVLRALAWLARELPFAQRDPILVAHPDRPLALDDDERFAGRAPAVAAALAGLDLWWSPPPSGAGERSAPRRAGLRRLYETKDEVDDELVRELAALDRPGIVLVTRRDRWRYPWLENKFGPLGFEVLKIVDSVALFVWPPALSELVPADERPFPEHHFPRGPAVLGREEER